MSDLTPETGIFSQAETPITFADGHFHFIQTFGNVGVIDTAEGVLLFDIGARPMGESIFQSVRAVTSLPIKFIVYGHGHFDHCFGYAPFQTEWEAQGWAPPVVIAHENALRRFAKYRMLGPYHAWINAQQFGSLFQGHAAEGASAAETLDPTVLVRGWEPYSFGFGNYSCEIHPAWGETDDTLWMYVPEGEVVFASDLFLWSFPNVGNPFKVQRYPKQWAEALEQILALDPQYLVPGHGPLIEGRDQVREALSVTAEALNFVHDGVVERLNQGKWFEDIYWEMMDAFPPKFRDSPYLRPIYGCYQFAIHAAYRLYHGWYDTGNPTDLFPARTAAIAREILQAASPVSGAETFLARARELFANGDNQMALHILDLVILGMGESGRAEYQDACNLKVKILKQIAKAETSFIARNIYLSAARRLQKNIKL